MRARRSRTEWAELIAAFEQSGQNANAFAAQHDLNINTLKWWRSRLRNSLTLVPLTVERLKEPEPLALVLELAGEVIVRVPASTATPNVGRFLGVFAKELCS